MKWIFLTMLLLPVQDKSVTLTGVTAVTSPGIPSAPTRMGIR